MLPHLVATSVPVRDLRRPGFPFPMLIYSGPEPDEDNEEENPAINGD